jgi:hypothetical protein
MFVATGAMASGRSLGTKGSSVLDTQRKGDQEGTSYDSWLNEGGHPKIDSVNYARLQKGMPLTTVQNLTRKAQKYIIKREDTQARNDSVEKILLTEKESTPSGTSTVPGKGFNVFAYDDLVKVEISYMKRDENMEESFSPYTSGDDHGYGRYVITYQNGALKLIKEPGVILDAPEAVSVYNDALGFEGEISVRIKSGNHYVVKEKPIAHSQILVQRVPDNYECTLVCDDKVNYSFSGSTPVKFDPRTQGLIISENENGQAYVKVYEKQPLRNYQVE